MPELTPNAELDPSFTPEGRSATSRLQLDVPPEGPTMVPPAIDRKSAVAPVYDRGLDLSERPKLHIPTALPTVPAGPVEWRAEDVTVDVRRSPGMDHSATNGHKHRAGDIAAPAAASAVELPGLSVSSQHQEKVARHVGTFVEGTVQRADRVSSHEDASDAGEQEPDNPQGAVVSGTPASPAEDSGEQTPATDTGAGQGPTKPPTGRPSGSAEVPDEEPEDPTTLGVLESRVERLLQTDKAQHIIQESGYSGVTLVRPASGETGQTPERTIPPGGYKVTDLEPGPERQREMEDLYHAATELTTLLARNGIEIDDITPGENIVVAPDESGGRHLHLVDTSFRWRLDLREIIPAAQAGDVDAQRTLTDYIDKSIERSLGQRSSDDPEYDALVAEIRTKLDRNPFDPFYAVPEGTDPARIPAIVQRRLQGYINRAAMTVVSAHLTARSRAEFQRLLPETVGPLGEFAPERTEQGYQNHDITSTLPPAELDRILTAEQRQVVALRVEGKTNAEIAEILGTTEGAIKQRASRARLKIEESILEPAGIKPLPDFPDSRQLWKPLSRGQIPGVKVLDTWYFSDNWRLRELPSGEYTRLSTTATHPEAIAFMRRHPERVVIFKGVAHINNEDMPLLAEIQETKRAARQPITPPQPDYTSIPDATRNRTEYDALRRAIDTGQFAEVLREKGRAFIRQEEARRFLEQFRRQRGLSQEE